ncbi:hypothetical protein Q0F99_01300 [Rathayibacter oskolensis]|uniref:hypothetical protein n=1 Tax=Rathayibacter oskolensis TaxID=1891671 RepID=UPI0026603DA9|nr:hypothetical protein [Rathayibacter oskolensis]WKK71843.1 hypothetical protein Q0F99_01300 [Rathayibacter oskolensis]
MSRQERDLARLTPRARTAAGPIAGFLLLTWTGFYFAAQFELDVQRWIIGLGTGVLVLLLCVPGFARWAGSATGSPSTACTPAGVCSACAGPRWSSTRG